MRHADPEDENGATNASEAFSLPSAGQRQGPPGQSKPELSGSANSSGRNLRQRQGAHGQLEPELAGAASLSLRRGFGALEPRLRYLLGLRFFAEGRVGGSCPEHAAAPGNPTHQGNNHDRRRHPVSRNGRILTQRGSCWQVSSPANPLACAEVRSVAWTTCL